MSEAYIVSPLRSPGGKAFRGSLAKTRPDDYLAEVMKGILKTVPSVDPAEIDDVIVGCAMPEAEQGMNVGRIATLLAGLPESVPAQTVNRFCSSGLQTVASAAALVKSGDAQCIFAGGVESMSLIPMMGHKVVGSRNINDNFQDIYLGMGLTAEKVAKEYSISREDQDKMAVDSHMKAIKAIEGGLFKDEIVPIQVKARRPGKDGNVAIKDVNFDTDEGPRADTSVEGLSKLKGVFLQGGTVTAGNSSQMTDGAAMCLVCSEEFVKKNNLTPIARLASYAVAGVPPSIMGIGPVAAVPKALTKAGISLKDINRIELNEAFAAQGLAVIKDLGLNPEIINPTGGAMALGHTLGATGMKLSTSILHGMKRDKQKYGLVTMCIGTGMGAAGVYELL